MYGWTAEPMLDYLKALVTCTSSPSMCSEYTWELEGRDVAWSTACVVSPKPDTSSLHIG